MNIEEYLERLHKGAEQEQRQRSGQPKTSNEDEDNSSNQSGFRR